MRTIIWDLDGCLFDERHRNHHSIAKDWPEYHKTVHLDTPLHHKLYRACHDMSCKIVVITGRQENCLLQTLECMDNHNVPRPHSFMMRKDDDTEGRSVDIKMRYLEALRESGHIIIAAFDDRPDIIEMYRDNGVSNAMVMGYDTSYHLEDIVKKIHDEAERLCVPILNAKSNHDPKVANETVQRTMVQVHEELISELKRLNSSVDDIKQFMIDKHRAEQDALRTQRNWKENLT